jgi:hypothetical protein
MYDTNKDGKISMAEYTVSATLSTVSITHPQAAFFILKFVLSTDSPSHHVDCLTRPIVIHKSTQRLRSV